MVHWRFKVRIGNGAARQGTIGRKRGRRPQPRRTLCRTVPDIPPLPADRALRLRVPAFRPRLSAKLRCGKPPERGEPATLRRRVRRRVVLRCRRHGCTNDCGPLSTRLSRREPLAGRDRYCDVRRRAGYRGRRAEPPCDCRSRRNSAHRTRRCRHLSHKAQTWRRRRTAEQAAPPLSRGAGPADRRDPRAVRRGGCDRLSLDAICGRHPRCRVR